MSWFQLALGLIREAATTELGQDIVNDVVNDGRAGARRGSGDEAPQASGAWQSRVEQRLTRGDRNTEALVRALNAQDEVLARIQKRQRIWNIGLTVGILATAAALLWTWL